MTVLNIVPYIRNNVLKLNELHLVTLYHHVHLILIE